MEGPRRSRGNSTPGGVQQPSSFDPTAFVSRREAAPAFGSADDNRYLVGAVLVDELRQQLGDAGFESLEAVRRKSVAFRREAASASAPQLRRELEELLDSAELPKKLNITRTFSYFSHLLNIAEDVEELRRQRAAGREGAAPAHGSIAAALARLEAAGVQPDEVRAWLGALTISPVLTAHPTEVQRKSIQDCEREVVSRLLQVRSFAAIEIGAPSAAHVEAAAGGGADAGARMVASCVGGSSSAVSLASMAFAAKGGAASGGTGAGRTSTPLARPPLRPRGSLESRRPGRGGVSCTLLRPSLCAAPAPAESLPSATAPSFSRLSAHPPCIRAAALARSRARKAAHAAG
jgi:hypothetical protein